MYRAALMRSTIWPRDPSRNLPPVAIVEPAYDEGGELLCRILGIMLTIAVRRFDKKIVCALDRLGIDHHRIVVTPEIP